MGQTKLSIKNIKNFEEEVKKTIKKELKTLLCQSLKDCLKEKEIDLDKLVKLINNKNWNVIV